MDNRRQSDHVLPLIIQRLDRQDQLSDEFRTRSEQTHKVILEKLECLPIMSMKIDHVEKWIETEGKPNVASVSRAKWFGTALALGGGAAGGTLFERLVSLFRGH